MKNANELNNFNLLTNDDKDSIRHCMLVLCAKHSDDEESSLYDAIMQYVSFILTCQLHDESLSEEHREIKNEQTNI